VAKNFIEEMSQDLEKPIIELISGIEISTSWNNKEIHILGYNFDLNSRYLKDLIERQNTQFLDIYQKIIDEINSKNKTNLKLNDFKNFIKDKSYIKPLFADWLVSVGAVRMKFEAFGNYLNNYNARLISPEKAVETIAKAGGISVLAHPRDIAEQDAEKFINNLIKSGLKGIEIFHYYISPEKQEFWVSIAKKYSLILTGGSDAHDLDLFLYPKTYIPSWAGCNLNYRKIP
jgi:hypothetical protein